MILACDKVIQGDMIERKAIEITPVICSFKSVSLTDLIEEIHVVPLTNITIEEAPIRVSQVEIYDDLIYIADKKYGRMVISDMGGEIQGSVGSIGSGPGNYASLWNFNINNDHIEILSNEDQKVHAYTLDGSFVGAKRFEFFADSFMKIDSGYLFYVNNNNAGHGMNALFTDDSLQVKKMALPYDADLQTSMISFSGFLRCDHNKVPLIAEPFTDTVLMVVDDLLTTKYIFNFKENGIPVHMRRTYDVLFNHLIDYSYLRTPFVETASNVVYSFQHRGTLNFGVYFKKTKANYFFNRKSNELDFIEKIIDFTSPVGSTDDGEVICAIDMERYQECKEEYAEAYALFKRKYPQEAGKLESARDVKTALLFIFFMDV